MEAIKNHHISAAILKKISEGLTVAAFADQIERFGWNGNVDAFGMDQNGYLVRL